MTEELEKLIQKAECKDHGTFNQFLIVPTGEIYDGFWGINGYDKMILLARLGNEADWCILTNQSDTFHLIQTSAVNFDIPSNLGCVRVFTDKPIAIHCSDVSSVIGFGNEVGVRP